MSERLLKACPSCESSRLAYSFSRGNLRVQHCEDCRLIFLNPQPEVSGAASREGRDALSLEAESLLLQELLQYRGQGGRLLELGAADGEFLKLARASGFEVRGIEEEPALREKAERALGPGIVTAESLESLLEAGQRFEVIVLSRVLERSHEPLKLLDQVHRLLEDGGSLLLLTPSLDSLSARLQRQNWSEIRPEHLQYFDSQSIRNLLAKSGFEKLKIGHFEQARASWPRRLEAALESIFPRLFRRARLPQPSKAMSVLGRKGLKRERPLLSILVPVYNEKNTFPELMSRLLGKQLPGLDREILLIESHSKDGTREEVLKFQGHPEVRVILEEEPKGKGHAVRAGIRAARGDFLIIQDGDLEYDVNDYDQLLEPLARYQRAFVLGSRHSGSWKIREYTDKPLLTTTANAAHLFFAFLLNSACGSRLKDPFTMYKVFRRDCVWDLNLKANRFDFDWEIVIKLLRKGYQPLEVPVNYLSRSWEEGKKIRIFKDPPTWVWALIRFRLEKL